MKIKFFKFRIKYDFCFLTRIIMLLYFVFFLSQNVFSQNGRYELIGIGGNSQIIGSIVTNMYPAPFLPNKKDSRVQFLYEAAESGLTLANLSGYTTISSLAFHVSGFSLESLKSYEMENIKISMGHTIATYDGYNGTEIWGIKMPPPGYCTWAGSPNPMAEPLQLVKNSFDLIINETGWIEIELDTPFVWDGINSIVVEICKADPKIGSAPAFSTGRYQFTGISHTTPSGSTNFTLTRSLYSNNNNGTGSNYTTGCNMELSGTSYNTSAILNATFRKFRPNIRFTFQCSGAPASGEAIIEVENFCKDEAVTIRVINDEKSKGLNYQWFYSYADDDNYLPLLGKTDATITVERANVDIWYKRDVGCNFNTVVGTRSSFPVKVNGINTWNGTFWSFGSSPLPSLPIRIQGDYDSTIHGSGVLEACSLAILSGTFTVQSGDLILLKDKINVHENATVVFENNASLIQENDFAVNEGIIFYKRDSQPVRMLDYTYWSSPVIGMTPFQFSPGTPINRIYHWNHLTTGPNPQSWVNGIANMPMLAGKGYIIRAPNGFPSAGTGNIFEGIFEGVPNNGLITLPAQGGSSNWNLIGNPYPAAIDANKFLLANSNVLDGTIRFWTHNTLPSAIPSYPGFPIHALNYSSDDYATYNLSGSIGIPSNNTGNNNSTPGRFIGAGQSFMIEGGSLSGNVVFNNEMRKVEIGYNNSQFFRNGFSNENEVDRKRLWLELIHQNGKFNQTMVGYIEGATNDLDWGYDAMVRNSGSLSINSFVGDNKLSIQGKALPFSTNDIIPLGFTTSLSGEFLIKLYQYDDFFEDQPVFLFDKYTNIFYNIKEEMYAFTSDSGIFDDRFELRFTDENLSLNPNLYSNNTILCYKKDNFIMIKSKDTQINTVQIFDSAGRFLYEEKDINKTELLVTDLKLDKQLLFIQIITYDNKKLIKKIIF
jgi:hypothetical protein